MKLSKAITAYLDDLRVRKSAATVTAYESDLNRFRFYVPMDTVLHVTPDAIQRFIVATSAAGIKNATLHRRIATLRSFCRWGVKQGLWASSPADHVEQVAKPKRLPRPYSDQDVNALLALELDPREALIRALLLYTGLRVTPICDIKVGDVSFMPPVIRATVKGARTQVIKLHPGLAELLRAYIAKHTDLKAYSFLLARWPGHHPLRRELERITWRWGQRARVADCTPHRFRHTFATKLLKNTRDIAMVKKALGHEDVNSTMIYTFVTDQDEADAVAGVSYGTELCDTSAPQVTSTRNLSEDKGRAEDGL